MENLSITSLVWTILVFTSFIASVCLHEFGHAIVAYWGGDHSVKEKGYLSLNPLKYTHPTYSIVMPLIFLLLGGIPLPGAAVYINSAALRTRGWRSAVSAAGPLATAIVAGAISIILKLMNPDYIGLVQGSSLSGEMGIDGFNLQSWFVQGLVLLLVLEVAGVFLNLIPVPGLDGFGIIRPWLSNSIQEKALAFSKYGILILFGAFWIIPDFNRGFWSLVYGTVQYLGVPPEISPIGFYLFRQGAQFIFFILLVGWVIIAQRKKRQSPPTLTPPIKSDELLEQELSALNQQLILGQDSELLSSKAAILIQLERYEDALVALEQALALHKDDSQNWAMKGYTLYLLSRPTDAIAAYQAALKIKPDNAYSWQGLGIAHCAAEEYDAAIAAYNQAFRYSTDSPTQAQILSLKSRPYFFLRRYDDCLLILQEVLAINSNDASAIYNQACCHAQLGNVEKGIACLENVMAQGNEALRQEAQFDPDLEGLRSHPKFPSLIREDLE